MKFVSTRAQAPALHFTEALTAGLASDGGLYVPESLPRAEPDRFAPELLSQSSIDVARLGAKLLQPFFASDPLEHHLAAICAAALDFPIPLKFLPRDTAVLELFHGPTAAFKDVGARFLAECLTRLRSHERPQSGTKTVLVATSGDTGGAVAGAFYGKPGIEVKILFPKGRISARQEKQLTSWGGNVRAFAVRGTFDDCQRVVKAAFMDPWWQANEKLISANSISIGRLLPQMIYHAKGSLEYFAKTGRTPGLIVPSGNLGDAVAALWAKRIGLPIGKVILATNANRPIAAYFDSGTWEPHETVPTLANAMDVGHPSNMERVLNLYPTLTDLKADVSTISVSDAEISNCIRRGQKDWGEIWCPHTATAVVAREKQGGPDWILVATAHPAKFETIVEPLIGQPVPVPPALSALLHRASHCTEIEPTLADLKEKWASSSLI